MISRGRTYQIVQFLHHVGSMLGKFSGKIFRAFLLALPCMFLWNKYDIVPGKRQKRFIRSDHKTKIFQEKLSAGKSEEKTNPSLFRFQHKEMSKRNPKSNPHLKRSNLVVALLIFNR